MRTDPLRSLLVSLVTVLTLSTLAACEKNSAPLGQGAETEPSRNADLEFNATDGTCGAGSLSPLLGRNIESIDAATLPSNRRILFTTAPDPVLDDPTRLTIRVEPSGRIVRLDCG